MITSDIKPIKGVYLIFKRIKKVPMYLRQGHNCSRNPKSATLFNTKESALETVQKLNAARKGGYKFRIDLAEKHVVNTFNVSYTSWNERVTVVSTLKSIQNIKEGFKLKHSLNNEKEKIIQQISTHITNLNKEIVEQEQRHCEHQNGRKNRVKRLQELMLLVSNTDIDQTFVEPNLTNSDINVKILYGG